MLQQVSTDIPSTESSQLAAVSAATIWRNQRSYELSDLTHALTMLGASMGGICALHGLIVAVLWYTINKDRRLPP